MSGRRLQLAPDDEEEPLRVPLRGGPAARLDGGHAGRLPRRPPLAGGGLRGGGGRPLQGRARRGRLPGLPRVRRRPRAEGAAVRPGAGRLPANGGLGEAGARPALRRGHRREGDGQNTLLASGPPTMSAEEVGVT